LIFDAIHSSLSVAELPETSSYASHDRLTEHGQGISGGATVPSTQYAHGNLKRYLARNVEDHFFFTNGVVAMKLPGRHDTASMLARYKS
jgi:hypothetical protein